MMPEPGKLVLVYLRRIGEEVDRVIDDGRDIMLERQARIQRRLDRVEPRLDRIERLLVPVEPPH